MKLLGFKIERDEKPRAGMIAESDFPSDFFNDPNFIPANPGGGIGLYPLNYFRANAQAERLSQSNGFYHRVIEIARDHICGQGITIKVDSDEADLKNVVPCIQKLCDNAFFGEENGVQLRYHQWIYESLLSGMLCIPAFVRKSDGFVEFGDLPARWIIDVVQNPRNASDALAIRAQPGEWLPHKHIAKARDGRVAATEGLRRETAGDESHYDVIRYNREMFERKEDGSLLRDPNTGLPIANPDYNRLSGDVFLFRLGNLRGQKFGQGMGFHIHDLCTELDQIIFLFRRAYEIQLNVVMEVTVKNADSQAKMNEMAEMVVPTAPVPFVHDGNVEFALHAPALRPADLTELVKTIGRFIAGIMGVPEFVMGDGTHTNVATAEQQAPAMYQKFNVLREKFSSYFAFMLRYVISEANEHGMLWRSYEENGVTVRGQAVKLTPEQLKAISVEVPLLPYERGDKGASAEFKALVDAVTGLLGLKVDGQYFIDPNTLRNLLAENVASMGFHVDLAAMDARTDTMTGVSVSGAETDYSEVS